MPYDSAVYCKYCIIHHFETLFEGQIMCVHMHKKIFRYFSPPLVIMRSETEQLFCHLVAVFSFPTRKLNN